MNTSEIGKKHETIAYNYLKKYGLKLIKNNFCAHFGEIDLIMQDKDTIVFIEVRFRGNNFFGTPIETISISKQNKIIKTAEFFLLKNKKISDNPCRFDVVAISKLNNNELNIEWVKNAFISF